VRPVIEATSARDQVDLELEIAGEKNDKLLLHYPAVKHGTGYVPPVVTLEFGGHATGEPHQVMPVTCDMDGHVQNVFFPTASPAVMRVARTFWEKATAAHVYCAQGPIRSARYARHWHDLAARGRSKYFHGAIADRAVATAVVQHKSFFFIEKDAAGGVIEYMPAVTGHLKIVPAGEALAALAADYANMLADAVMVGEALPFDELMRAVAKLRRRSTRRRCHNDHKELQPGRQFALPWQCLYFLPEPHGHRSLRPTFASGRVNVCARSGARTGAGPWTGCAAPGTSARLSAPAGVRAILKKVYARGP